MKKTLLFVLTAILIFAANGNVQAAVLLEQGLTTSVSGTISDSGKQVVADEFTLTQDATINDLHWYGYYYTDVDFGGTTALDFDIRFYSDSSGLPGSLLYNQIYSTPFADSGYTIAGTGAVFTVYKYDLSSITPFNVSANDQLWLSISETDSFTTDIGVTQWVWNHHLYESGTSKATIDDADPDDEWSSAQGDMAFSLTGEEGAVVPEPATMLLLGFGLIGAAGLRKK